MGRNPTPTAILDARGGFINRPSRERPDEPSTAGRRPLGPPPSYLSAEEKKVWKRLAKEMLPGVAFASDRTAFELLTRLTAKLRAGQMSKSSDMATLITLCSRFAMTPADRSRVVAEQPKESSLSKFLSRRNDPVQ
jgi:phage terminase small subunit